MLKPIRRAPVVPTTKRSEPAGVRKKQAPVAAARRASTDSFAPAVREMRARIPAAYVGDVMYYAIGELTAAEIKAVSPQKNPRGTVVVWDHGRVITGAA